MTSIVTDDGSRFAKASAPRGVSVRVASPPVRAPRPPAGAAGARARPSRTDETAGLWVSGARRGRARNYNIKRERTRPWHSVSAKLRAFLSMMFEQSKERIAD